MIRIALHAGAFAATVLTGSMTAAALSWSPNAAPGPEAAIDRAFTAVAGIKPGSADLRAALLLKAHPDRLPTLITDRAVRAAALDVRPTRIVA